MTSPLYEQSILKNVITSPIVPLSRSSDSRSTSSSSISPPTPLLLQLSDSITPNIRLSTHIQNIVPLTEEKFQQLMKNVSKQCVTDTSNLDFTKCLKGVSHYKIFWKLTGNIVILKPFSIKL